MYVVKWTCVHVDSMLKDLRKEASDNCLPADEASDSSDEMAEMIVDEPTEKWDCETILCEH